MEFSQGIEEIMVDQGPRIYNLFPLLVGSITSWEGELERIAGMGFNWVYLNPFHYPGFSGSLYAVKDYYRINPLFLGDSNDKPFKLLQKFLQRAEGLGLSVMMDLVINHTAKDSALVMKHPEWFKRNPDGSIKSPSAIDPADARKVTIWGDLAEINYQNPAQQGEILAYWQELVEFYIRLGFKGFRCDAAYKIPSVLWSSLIQAAKRGSPQVIFFAETLGCRLEEVETLTDSGFDYLFNSSKWWDFHQGWLLKQYEDFRQIAPSISFPESHDTPRLAQEVGGRVEIIKLRYLFAAFFSRGILIPIGYEFGFRKGLDVVRTRPSDWEEPVFDLTDFITDVNLMKASSHILNDEGPIERISPAKDPVVILVKSSPRSPGRVLALINSEVERSHWVYLKELPITLRSSPKVIQELTPKVTQVSSSLPMEVGLEPAQMRVYYVH